MSVCGRTRREYKWVVLVPYADMYYFFKTKPKQVRGGYMVAHGRTFIGKGVTLLSRKEYVALEGGF